MSNADQALLNAADFDRLALCVEAIGTQDFPKAICEYCAAICRADTVFLNAVFDEQKPAPLFSNHIEENQRESLNLYLDVAFLLDPFVLLIREKQGDAVIMLRTIAPDDFMRSEYYHKFYKEMGLADECALIFICRMTPRCFFRLGSKEKDVAWNRTGLN